MAKVIPRQAPAVLTNAKVQEAIGETPAESIQLADEYLVENISTKNIPLASGLIAPGEQGMASNAEISVWHQYIAKV